MLLQSRRLPNDISLLLDDSASAFQLALKLHDQIARITQLTNERIAISALRIRSHGCW